MNSIASRLKPRLVLLAAALIAAVVVSVIAFDPFGNDDLRDDQRVSGVARDVCESLGYEEVAAETSISVPPPPVSQEEAALFVGEIAVEWAAWRSYAFPGQLHVLTDGCEEGIWRSLGFEPPQNGQSVSRDRVDRAVRNAEAHDVQEWIADG